MPAGSTGPAVPWAAIPLFQSLRPEEREALRPIVHLRSYEPGERIFREGEPSSTFYFVLGGRVKVIKSVAGGREVILEIFGTGDPVGVLATYEEREFPATAIALEPATLLSIPRDDLFGMLASNPRLVRGLLSGLTRRMVELTRKLAERGSRVECRIARLFLTLADRFGRPGEDGVRINLALSRREIADLVGATQETAIRVMSRWGKENVLLTEDGGFRLPDRPRLERIAEGE